MAVQISGRCHTPYTAVGAAFDRIVSQPGHVGSAVCVTVGGDIVVDLWAGHTRPERTEVWDEHTIVNTFSATKAMTALCAHVLIDRGFLEVDAPVARYWPEFAAAGKESLPVRYVLDHRIGLPWVSPGRDGHRLFGWDETVRRLAARAPMYPPGSRAVYHALSFGYLVGEIVRRITGQTLGAFFDSEIARVLGVEFYIGVPETSTNTIAEVVPPVINGVTVPILADIDNGTQLVNSRAWRAAEIPAVNGHGNARALATVMGALANGGTWDGVRLVRAPSIATMWQRSDGHGGGPDDPAWALGFMPNWNNFWGPSDASFGHTGFGGSMCCADPETGVSIAYVTNTLSTDDGVDQRAAQLVAATYASLTESASSS